MARQHKCHAIECETPCKPSYLMCGPHWAMVSFEHQTAVRKAYRHGQCAGRVRPSPTWLAAANHAIADVAEREGRDEQAKLWRNKADYFANCTVDPPFTLNGTRIPTVPVLRKDRPE